MGIQFVESILFATIVAGTPLIIVALGELITEKSGVINLGAEGMMSVGAIAGFAVTLHSGSHWIGITAAMLSGMALAAIFACLTISLLANQVASGLALAIFGVGLSAFIGKPYEGATLPTAAAINIPYLSDIPVIGKVIFGQQSLVYISWIIVALVLWFLYKSRTGLVLRAVGESPAAAHSIGYKVVRYRYCATMFGGAMAGLGGSFLSVFYTPSWAEGMVAGKGWIALALVVFATWRPWRVVIGAYLFGGVLIAQLFVQGSGLKINIPAQLLSSLPYLATIVVLVIISRNALLIRLNSPASLGKPFHPSQ